MATATGSHMPDHDSNPSAISLTHSKFIHGTFKGEPAITIPLRIEESLAAKFQTTLVGKFSQGKPGMDSIRRFISLQNFKGGDRLKLFEADLQEGSFDEAIRGCHGLFHVAASMELLQVPVEDNVDSYVQTKVIEPAIKGTLNVMKSCLRSGSIKRVVFTSSISTLTAKKDDSEDWKSVVDETSNVSISHVWETKSSGWVYVLSKLLTEQAAFEFCKENEMDMVSVPISVRLLFSPLTGDPFLSSILESVKSRMGSIAMVHIEDICNAHVFLMEHSETPEGRYICSVIKYNRQLLLPFQRLYLYDITLTICNIF